jgi:hypothetical protein
LAIASAAGIIPPELTIFESGTSASHNIDAAAVPRQCGVTYHGDVFEDLSLPKAQQRFNLVHAASPSNAHRTDRPNNVSGHL